MTTATTNPPRPDLDRLIARHGARAVLASLLRVLLGRHATRRRARRDAALLSNHIRADIGLPPIERGPRPWQSY